MARVAQAAGGCPLGSDERLYREDAPPMRRGSDLRRNSIPEEEEAAWWADDEVPSPDRRRRGSERGGGRPVGDRLLMDARRRGSKERNVAPPGGQYPGIDPRPRRRSSTELSEESEGQYSAQCSEGLTDGVSRRDSGFGTSDMGSANGDEDDDLDFALDPSQLTVPTKRRLSHSLPELKLLEKVQQFLLTNPPASPAASPAKMAAAAAAAASGTFFGASAPGCGGGGGDKLGLSSDDEGPLTGRRKRIDLSRHEYRQRSSSGLSLHDDSGDDALGPLPGTARSDLADCDSAAEHPRPALLGGREARRGIDLDRADFRRRSQLGLPLRYEGCPEEPPSPTRVATLPP